jgi:hypothetical protein
VISGPTRFVAVLLALAALVVYMDGIYGARARRRPRRSGVFGGPLPTPKNVALPQLIQRARFPVLLPSDPQGRYRLERSHLAWVPGSTNGKSNAPGRQMACLYYRLPEGQLAALIEARTSPGQVISWNEFDAVGRSAFFGEMRFGMHLTPGRVDSADFLIVSTGDVEEVDRLQGTLRTMRTPRVTSA